MQILFFKSHVDQHLRTLKSGKTVIVEAHDRDSSSVGSNDRNRGLFDRHFPLIRKMYAEGQQVKIISEKTGIHKKTILKWVREDGIYAAKTDKKTDEQKKFALKLYKEGTPLSEIVSRSGLSLSAIRKVAFGSGDLRTRSESTAIRAARESVNYHRGNAGYFHSKKMGAWVSSASSYEHIRMGQLEDDANVVEWRRCSSRLRYVFDGKEKTYIPDLEVSYANGDFVIEEIKPSNFVNDPVNLAKFSAAREFCEARGYKFRVITENEVGNGRKIKSTIPDLEKQDRAKKLARDATRRYRAKKLIETPLKKSLTLVLFFD